ncbi:M23 family metallopeptidase [Pedobacter miscanthi]|uniref:M23 family metallopeptidase n=1 Tax=Pedobacter miscanthi TaxID=2259170 RepID=UPI001313EEC8|nr:M23 family metallopeptidase [Pedobacter miscanthi]
MEIIRKKYSVATLCALPGKSKLWSLVLLEVVLLFLSIAHAQSFDGLSLSLPLRRFKINSGFGYRTHPVTGIKNSYHTGIDLHAKSDTVLAILPGKVVKVSSDEIIGNYIVIAHVAYTSIYGHLFAPLVRAGNLVASGTPIAISGSTGRVTGEHLHFGIKHKGVFVDPLRMIYLFSNMDKEKLYLFLNDFVEPKKPPDQAIEERTGINH